MEHKESILKENTETKGQERKHEVNVESQILVRSLLTIVLVAPSPKSRVRIGRG